MKSFVLSLLCFVCYFNLNAQEGTSESEAEKLAKQLQNPIASLISIPFQSNFDFNIGPLKGDRFTMNIQPVIPISISDNWNLIGRAVIPIISQNDVFGGSGVQTGLSDAVVSAFFSPKTPTQGGLIWGAGPVLLVPTATDQLLGTEKFGVGPTAVALKQVGSFTIGTLVNHIWSIAGADDRADINNTFIQPFIARNFSGGYALTLNTEFTQNWDADASSGFLHLIGSKVVKLGKQSSQLFIGPRIPYGNANTTEWGIRAGLTLLFPAGS